jgi:steroid delta-isomerase-like uncharacterized protein
MSGENRRKQLLLGFLQEVWSEGDVEACGKYLAPRYTIHHDPGDPWDRRQLDLEGFKERVRRSRAPFPDQRFKVQELFAEASAVVVTWLWSGTHRGDLPGFPASGRVIEMSGMTAYYFKGDRIAGHWQVTDRLGVFQQLQRNAAARAP